MKITTFLRPILWMAAIILPLSGTLFANPISSSACSPGTGLPVSYSWAAGEGGVYVGGSATSAVGSVSVSSGSSIGSFSATLTDCPAVTMTINGSSASSVASPGGGLASSGGNLQALVSFMVVGTPGTTVPVLIQGSWSASVISPIYPADAAGELIAGGGTYGAVTDAWDVQTFRGSNSQSGSINLALNVIAGDVNQYQLQEDVVVTGSAFGASSAYAYVDPLITIDPSFPNASQYSVIVSEGVGNALAAQASTPEPATALLAAPVIALFLWRRRRAA